MEFKNITSELYRAYTFPGGDTITIHNPKELNVSDSGGHRILDQEGISHYIPKGWIHLHWRVQLDQPAFSF